MANNPTPSIEQLKRAVQIHEQIEKLQAELAAVFGQKIVTGAKRGRKPKILTDAIAEESGEPSTKKKAKKTRVMSPEAREKIAAAQRKRWSKQRKAAKKAGAPASEE